MHKCSCGREFSTPQGLGMHRKRAHRSGMSLVDRIKALELAVEELASTVKSQQASIDNLVRVARRNIPCR